MAGRQRIDRARRDYNKWVGNQTLEDYALRFTAKSARRWSSARVGQTAFGAVSFLALEAVGGSVTLSYGFTNAVAAIMVSVAIIFATALPICIHAARAGVDIDLLTRGAGFGYIGSTITSLIYASFTFLFFAIESVILAMALELCLGVPQPIGYLASALVVVPLVTFGISAISRFQVWTQPLFLVLNAVPVVALVAHRPQLAADWSRFAGLHSGDGRFDLLSFGAAVSVTIALVVQVGEQVDFLRFLPVVPRRDRRSARRWWGALLISGPGWVLGAVPKLLAGSFLGTVLVNAGLPRDLASEPPRMYAYAFVDLVGRGPLALALTLVLVLVCQLKINVTNAYAGSIAWSNFFSRLTHMHPGRVVWLVFNVLVALLVMELGVYRALEQTLAFYSSVAVAWIGALVADLVINKPLGLSPPGIEFKRAHLYDINPVGVGAMAAAILVATAAQLGAFGPLARALSPFLALAVALCAAPLIAWATGGRYYLARSPGSVCDPASAETCCMCETVFEGEDMAHCPAYDGPICSLCCTLDARCHDLCKPHGRFSDQAAAVAERGLPRFARAFVQPHVAEYMATFTCLGVLVAGVLALVGVQLAADQSFGRGLLLPALTKIFAALMIVIGIASWWLHLNRMSQRRARGETLRQTDLLMEEIAAHERTDAALKKAKEAAEAANFAKSRYVVGLSHELRTPLNAIMGYAQLLEGDGGLAERPRRQVGVMRRNAGHLAALIDGLLDIAKIEAGKLDLARDEVAIRQTLAQIIDPFAIQAAAKNIGFSATIAPTLPVLVACDEKRLRQILINLLSNAIKFTSEGEVAFTVTYRNQVAECLVRDTGPGIGDDDLERIFMPFERLHGGSGTAGTGLGLTICRLLANVMGGDISLTSEPGVGSTFRVRLFLPPVHRERRIAETLPRAAYGRGRKVLVVDDNPTHCDLIVAALEPAGFTVGVASNAADGLRTALADNPDLLLLDIEMPEVDGWSLAERYRRSGLGGKIVMVSASAMEEHRAAIALPFHDAFLMKPVDFDRLHAVLADLLDRGAKTLAPELAATPRTIADLDPATWPDPVDIARMIGLCEIGFVSGLRQAMDDLATREPRTREVVSVLSNRLDAMDLRGLMRELERVGAPVP